MNASDPNTGSEHGAIKKVARVCDASNKKKFREWFLSFVEDRPIEATENELLIFIEKKLKLSILEFDATYKQILPLLLVVYINSWPGWNLITDFRKGDLSLNAYYGKFKEYLRVKLNMELPKIYEKTHFQALNELRCEFFTENSALKICGPADFILSLNFHSDGNDDILVENSKIDITHIEIIKKLSTIELINWPFIRVTFINDDLFFWRQQICDAKRYLYFDNTVCDKFSSDGNIIESAVMVPEGVKRCSYTYSLLQAYVKEYLEVLTKKEKCTRDKLEEIKAVLEQFLADIRRMNVQPPKRTIATNTKILFNLTNIPYVRQFEQHDRTTSELSVGYCEIIKPKIELFLYHFRAKINVKEGATQETPFRIREKAKKLKHYYLLPKIYYACNLCNKTFRENIPREDVLSHLIDEHKKIDGPVKCMNCDRTFNIKLLANVRWKHSCT